MLLSRAHRRFTTWLALLAMVLGALAPTVAQAMVASSERSDWVEVCSVSGMVWVQLDADSASDEPAAPDSAVSMHCPWCTLHGGAAGLPSAEVQVQPLKLPASPLLSQVTVWPTPGIWAVAQARAPPQAL